MNALLELDLASPSFCLDVYMKTVQYQSLSVYVCAYNYSMSISYNNGGEIGYVPPLHSGGGGKVSGTVEECVFVCLCTRVCVCSECIYTFVHACVLACVCACLQVCVHVCMYAVLLHSELPNCVKCIPAGA